MNLTGIVSITKPNYQEAIVNGKIILGYQNLNHCFHGDIVDTDGVKIIKILETTISNKMIPGILHISSKYKFGFNKKKMPIYRFVPLDWKYPDFMVATSMKGENKFVIINFMNWTQKFPNGRIVKVYNNFDYEMLMYKWNLYQPSIKFDIDSELSPFTLFSNADLINHNDCTNLDVFSIDPKESLDIDDALSIDKIDDGYRVGIHIADVSFYVKQFNLEQLLENRYSSIYLPNKVVNMIPDIFANHLCSLRENKDRLAHTIWIKFNKHFEIEDYWSKKTIICNKKQYNYDEADKIFIDKDIFQISKHLGENMFNMDINNWTTHEMIEVYMLLCNHIVGMMLKDNPETIYRIHTQKNIDNDVVQSDYPELNKMIKILNSESAEYVLSKNTDNYTHYGVNLKYYTHFTSPIRRIVDIYIHQLLNSVTTNLLKIDCETTNQLKIDCETTNQLKIDCETTNQLKIDCETTNLLKIDCEKLNQYNRNVKKLQRDIQKHLFIQSIIEKGSLKYDAYIIKIEETHLTIYISSEKIMYKFRVFDKLLDHLIENTIVDNKIKYLNQHSLREIEIELYEKVNITIHSKYDNRNIIVVIDKLLDFY